MGDPLGALLFQLARTSICISESSSEPNFDEGKTSSLIAPSKTKSIPGDIDSSPIIISGSSACTKEETKKRKVNKGLEIIS